MCYCVHLFVGIINSFVHIIMYMYYLLAALLPHHHHKRYLWWKKYITTLQMVRKINAFNIQYIDEALSFKAIYFTINLVKLKCNTVLNFHVLYRNN